LGRIFIRVNGYALSVEPDNILISLYFIKLNNLFMLQNALIYNGFTPESLNTSCMKTAFSIK